MFQKLKNHQTQSGVGGGVLNSVGEAPTGLQVVAIVPSSA